MQTRDNASCCQTGHRTEFPTQQNQEHGIQRQMGTSSVGRKNNMHL